MARPSSSRAHDNDRLRLPPASPPHKSEAGKKESADHPLNQRCQPCATPSSSSSPDQILSDVRIAECGSARNRGVSKSAKVVLDPYLGAGSTAIAALKNDRNAYGCDIVPAYIKIAKSRL